MTSKIFEIGLTLIAMIMALMLLFAIPTMRANPDEGANILVNILKWFGDALVSLVKGEVDRAVQPFLWLASAPVAVVILWLAWHSLTGGD